MNNQQDIQFGQTAVTLGLLTATQLAHYLSLQKNYQQQQQFYSLSNLLLKDGELNKEQIDIIENRCTMQLQSENKPSTFANGRYQVLSELGRGGMGCVYKAYDTTLKRAIALKVLLTQGNEDSTARFLLEARAIARLQHPSIIGVYDVVQTPEHNFFTMDFIEGSSLQELIKGKPSLTTRQIVQILVKVGEAIHYAHEQNIIHRDLKPANIMIDKERNPKVMDFGLAKVLDEKQKLSRSGTVIGTVHYMPPEQAEGKSKEIDSRTDVYSLGVILYEAITGRVPFTGNTFIKVVEQILYKPPVAPRKIKPRIPTSLEKICLKALEKEKLQRYQTAKEFTDDLILFSEGKEVKTRSWWQFAFYNIKKHKITLAAIIVLGTIAILLWPNPKKSATLDITLQTVNHKKLAQKKFMIKKPIQVEVKWLSSSFGKIEIYGKGIEYNSKDYPRPQQPGYRKLYFPIELSQKRTGIFEVIVAINEDGLQREKSIQLLVEKEPQPPEKKLPLKNVANNSIHKKLIYTMNDSKERPNSFKGAKFLDVITVNIFIVGDNLDIQLVLAKPLDINFFKSKNKRVDYIFFINSDRAFTGQGRPGSEFNFHIFIRRKRLSHTIAEVGAENYNRNSAKKIKPYIKDNTVGVVFPKNLFPTSHFLLTLNASNMNSRNWSPRMSDRFFIGEIKLTEEGIK